MIQIILGAKGTGKTKRLLDITNEALKVENGEIVFIDDDKRYMFDLRHEIRFIDARDYGPLHGCNPSQLLCFLYGMLSVNYDITLVSIDAFKKIVKQDLDSDEMKEFFVALEKLSEAHRCKFVISIGSEPDEVPEFIRQFAV